MVRAWGDGFVEVAFRHCPSRTPIVTDLMQRFETCRVDGRLARAPLRLAIEVRAMLTRHRRSVREAIARVKAWRLERIVPAHGPCIIGDGAAGLGRAIPDWAPSILVVGRHGRTSPDMGPPDVTGGEVGRHGDRSAPSRRPARSPHRPPRFFRYMPIDTAKPEKPPMPRSLSLVAAPLDRSIV